MTSYLFFVIAMISTYDSLLNFKFKFKFKFKCVLLLLMTLLTQCVSDDTSSSDYLQSFEWVAVFHNHVTYGHLGVTIDFDGYLKHFHVLRKSVISFEENNMSVYVKSVFSRLISVLDTNMFKIEEYKSLFARSDKFWLVWVWLLVQQPFMRWRP